MYSLQTFLGRWEHHWYLLIWKLDERGVRRGSAFPMVLGIFALLNMPRNHPFVFSPSGWRSDEREGGGEKGHHMSSLVRKRNVNKLCSADALFGHLFIHSFINTAY